MKKWKREALFIIGEIERGASEDRTTINEIARRCGISRWTFWRDADIRSRYREATVARQLEGRSKRRSTNQKLALLQLQNEELKRRNEALIANFIIVARRLIERGIDPATVLGTFAPNQRCNAWEDEILDWEDQ